MATTVRSVTQASAPTPTTLPLVTPASQATGDVLVVVLHVNSNPITITQTSAQAATHPLTVDSASAGQVSHSAAVFSRRIQSGDPTQWEFIIGSSNRWTLLAWLFQSPHASVIYDVAPTFNWAGVGSPVNSPTITTLTANAIHCAMAGIDFTTASLWTALPGSGYTIHYPTAALPTGGGDEPVAGVSKVIASASATGTLAFTSDQSGSAHFGLSFAIRDDGGGGGGGGGITPQAMHMTRMRKAGS
jgi:hypothetical protein